MNEAEINFFQNTDSKDVPDKVFFKTQVLGKFCECIYCRGKIKIVTGKKVLNFEVFHI
jgi:hypothetical protein